jgi:hypothetical protein
MLPICGSGGRGLHVACCLADRSQSMCRYAFHTYKEPFACFSCRKVFKQTSRWELPEHQRPAHGDPRVVKCPQCSALMADMGHDFKAPKQSAADQWEKIRILYEHGFAFQSCGCCGPGYRPTELEEVYEFIEGHRPKSEGELLLKRFEERSKPTSS